MSEKKGGPRKKVVKTTEQVKKKVNPTTSRLSKTAAAEVNENDHLLFGKENFIIMGAGLLLIFLGFILMAGGSMPSDDVWDPNLIYSFRRITLAPILVLAGLCLEIYAIFKR